MDKTSKGSIYNWRKLGKIFDPSEHDLGTGIPSYAQSPQTLLFDDYVRIYFSTRSVDPSNGKFLSHIRFVDMTKDLQEILFVAKDTVISLGDLGSFDEHGIFPVNLIRNGAKVFAYTCGWNRRTSVSVDTSIGLAISNDDGRTFDKYGKGPILGPSLKEPFLVGDGFTLKNDDLFHMWYIFGTRWSKPTSISQAERVYKIGHAFSEDGMEWTKEDGRQIISDVLGDDECQALPTVIKIDDRFHMFFCFRYSTDFRSNPKRAYRIGHASSTDLVNWVRDDSELLLDVSREGWDSQMVCYPHVFSVDGRVYLIYNGNNFGRDGFGAAELVCQVETV